jgi:TonB family protein
MSSLPVSKTGAPSPDNVSSAKSSSAKDVLRNPIRALLQKKLEEIVVLTRESTAADGVAVALRENGQFFCRASQGFAPEPGVVVEPGQGVCGRCIIDARVLVCQDLSGDVKSAVAAPVIVGDEIEGLIAAFSFRQSAFTPEHIDLVSRVAVDIGNQIASPETIHLVPRDPVSILNDPRVNVVAVDETEPITREKQLEILGAVTAPGLAPIADADVVADPAPPVELITSAEQREPELLPFHLFGYDESLQSEPDPTPNTREMLGEYLSKWDIVVIFGAVLIAMIAFSAWVHHRRAQASQPYVAQYSTSDVQAPGTAGSSPSSADIKSASNNSESDRQPTGKPSKTKAKPIPVAAGPNGLVQKELKPPTIQLASASINPALKTPPLPDPATAISGPTAPAELVRKVDPVYPSDSRAATQGGVVTLDLKVGTDGKVGIVKVLGGNNPFVSSALNAVRQWRYEPAIQNGKKIESSVRVDIPFEPNSR